MYPQTEYDLLRGLIVLIGVFFCHDDVPCTVSICVVYFFSFNILLLLFTFLPVRGVCTNHEMVMLHSRTVTPPYP